MTSDARAAATKFFDLDPASVRCPYPILGTLRGEAPVAWFDQLDAFVVSRYDLIAEVLRQPDKFSSKSATGKLTKRQVAKMMAELVAEDDEGRGDGRAPLQVRHASRLGVRGSSGPWSAAKTREPSV